MSDLDPLAGLRKLGLEQFEKVGLPSRKLEEWHYTDLSQTGVNGFPVAEPVRGRAEDGVIHLVNGFLQGEPALPAGVRLERLESSVTGQAMIGTLLSGADRALTALNAGLFNDALVLHVAAGAQIAQPVELLSETRSGAEGLQFHGRLLVIVEEGASLTLAETHRGQGSSFANWVGEIRLGQGAALTHVKLQDEAANMVHMAALGLELAAGARYQGSLLHLGAKLARHEVQAVLAGAGAEFTLDGATLAVGSQHIDNTTRVIHRAPNCQSRQLFKTVLDEQGHGVFQGTVFVERPAQKTNAHQLSRALMLSDQAAMDNKPELEIYADDVKCGHGATIGDIDEDALFYLQSRGIDSATARRLLIEAFLGEVVEQIADTAIQQRLGDLLRDRLAGLAVKEHA